MDKTIRAFPGQRILFSDKTMKPWEVDVIGIRLKPNGAVEYKLARGKEDEWPEWRTNQRGKKGIEIISEKNVILRYIREASWVFGGGAEEAILGTPKVPLFSWLPGTILEFPDKAGELKQWSVVEVGKDRLRATGKTESGMGTMVWIYWELFRGLFMTGGKYYPIKVVKESPVKVDLVDFPEVACSVRDFCIYTDCSAECPYRRIKHG
jgi:hypothetical protein